MFGLRKIIKLFENYSVCVTGAKGTGKDVLFGNVVSRRKVPYVSNMNYTQDVNFNRLIIRDLCLNGNKFTDVVNGKVIPYVYPYPKGSDIYISDVGIYFPAQYCNELNKLYPELPLFSILSRQLGRDTKIHFNVQHLGRCWDKIREHGEIYIRCNKCIVLFGKIVIQVLTIYDKYESCLDRVNPCRVRGRLFGTADAQVDIYKDNFYNVHGKVERKLLIYLNKSKHDTYYFEKFFANGGLIDENDEKKNATIDNINNIINYVNGIMFGSGSKRK